MASTINATTTGSGGLITTGNSVNQLELQTGDTTRLVIDGSGNVTIQGQGDLRLADSDSSHYVALQAAGTMSSNVTFTLPSADGTSGQVIQTNGSGVLSFTTLAGGFSNLAVLTSGTSWTAPAGVSKIKVIVTGGGGGGSGASNASYRTGSGGAAGATAIKIFTVTPGNSYTYAIGAAGSAGSSGGGNGGAGGNSTFTVGATTVTANGGAGGVYLGAAGATGGTATNGDMNIDGGDATVGTAGTARVPGGAGGASYWGGGAANRDPDTVANGQPGKAYGSGGGGGATNGGGNAAGGDGKQGVIVIEY